MLSVNVLEFKNICKTYQNGDSAVLVDVCLAIEPGEVIAIVGPSGCGKSTMLHIAGLIDAPNAGNLVICGKDTLNITDNQKTFLRSSYLGFVYQYHHLLHEFSALENVMMPSWILNKNLIKDSEHAKEILCELGMESRLHYMPSELSGGQKQRVAIARALINSPRILLADEPTGNLDPACADLVISDLFKIVKSKKMALLFATHNHIFANMADRVFRIVDCKLEDITRRL